MRLKDTEDLFYVRDSLRKVRTYSHRYKDALVIDPGLLAEWEKIEPMMDRLSANITQFIKNEYAAAAADGYELGDLELAQLNQLNDRLYDLGDFLNAKVREFTPDLERRIADPSDPTRDYEIQAEISYILKDDDPECSDDSDNILYQDDMSISVGFDNEGYIDDPLFERLARRPCWLFQTLVTREDYEGRPALGARNSLRVGGIWVDIKVWHQFFYDTSAGEWIDRFCQDGNDE